MTKFKRTLSALLAVVMAFTTMTIAFTVVSSAAPTVPRTPSSVLSPSVIFTVPKYLQTYGTDYYQGGDNIKSVGEIQATVTSTSTATVENISLACSDAGVQLSPRTQSSSGESNWTVQGGVVKTPAASDGSTVVKWTLSYTIAGKQYKTYAWSQVRPLINDPGFAVHVRHKNSLSYETHNYHVEWIGPVLGNPATETVSNFSQCYVHQGQGSHGVASGRYATSYFWDWDQGSGDDEDHTAGSVAKGTIYADYSQVTTLGEIGVASVGKTHALLEDASNHPQKYLGTKINSQYYQGSQADGIYSLTDTGSTTVGVGGACGATFNGPLPPVRTEGGTAQINAQIRWEGNVDTDVLHWQHSYHRTTCTYQINIVTYDKSALWTAISAATESNYQQSQFRNENPGTSTRFRSWDQYMEALQNAWFIYGKEDVTQSAINDAVTQLTQATPKYDANTGAWISGMMYADADYSGIDSIYNTISQTLDNPDFFVTYSDGVYGKYYQYSLAMALIDAIDDIKIEYNLEHDDEIQKTPLDARYQGTVDQMRTNLMNAVNALIETPTRQTSKLVSVEFIANETGVSGMPASVTTSMTGQFTKPTTNPSKQYYKFTGWYFDAEATQPVTWPLYIDPDNPHFKANLDAKVDNAGVAYTLYAGWQISGKTLTFDTQGGSEIPMAIGENGAPYSGPTQTPTKEGCRFLGWYTDDTFSTPVNWNTFTFGSLSVVYALWTADRFTVTFYANGGSFSGGSDTYTVTDLYGTPVSAPTPPTQTGVGFNGWYYDSALSQPVDMSTFTIPGYNIQLFAKWTEDVRNVLFYPENGDEPVFLTVDVGSRVERPEDPVKPGYTFKGWYGNPRGTGSPKTFPITVGANNVTLFAIYTPLKFTITFDPGDGEMAPGFNAAAYQNLNCGSVVTHPADPIKTDYVFNGWTLNGEPYELTTVPAENITLVATYVEEPYTATFRLRTDVTDNTVSQGDVITATVSMTANRVVSNHSFVVYYDKRYMVPYFNGKAVTSISGSAACSKIPGRAYFTLVQNAGGNVTDIGSPTGRITPGNIAPATQYFPADWVVDNRTLKEEYSNYEFVYYDAPDVSTGTRIRPEGEVDIASFQFLVLQNAELADGVTNYAQLLMSSDFVRTPERTNGKIAASLQPDTTYTNVKNWDGTTNVVVDGDHRFAVTQMQACSINFITNGGNPVEPIEAKQGGTAALPTPTRDYYNFLGWTLTNDANDTDYVSMTAFPVPVQDSTTLYAKWAGKQVNYYVRHHKQNLTANGFLENYEQQIIKGEVGTTVTATVKDYPGFTCTNPSTSGVVRGETSNPLILDLWYLRNTTTITLDTNGGKFSNNQQMMALTGLFDTAVTNVPADPTRDGYIFSGWENNTVPYTISKYPANDVTLTAEWTAKTITLNFYLDGETTPYATKVGKYGDPIEVPTDPQAPNGRVFTGWETADGTSLSTFTTFPANDTDFYGSIVIDGHILTLYVGGQQYGDPIEVQNGTQVTEASIGYTPDPGYRFTGWRTENSKDGPLAAFPLTLTQDTALYGFTEREAYSIHTVVYFDGEPEEGPSVNNIFYGAAFDLPEPDDLTDYGYGFHGWFTDPELTTPYTKPATMPAENLVLYGEYYLMTGTIEFDLNGGTGTAPASITRTLGTTVNLPAGTGITRKYYTFGGWSSSPTGTTALTKYTFVGEGTVKMYAIWKVNYATLTFSLNGAESGTEPENMQAEIGEAIPASALPSGEDFFKTGYIFMGWADKANATTALTSYTATSVGTKTLYAVWVADTVTLVAREGSTAVIDDARGFIYGLDFEVTESMLRDTYLDVIGNGHLEFSAGEIGTGTVVHVVNDFTGQDDATYQIVIFGDLNGDGRVNSTDVTEIRNINAGLADYSEDSAQYFAADITHDGLINSTDVTEIRSANARMTTISQAI